LTWHVTYLDLDPDKNIPTPSPPEEIKSSISNGQTIGNNTNSAFAPVTKSQTETKLNDVSPKVEELSPDKKALAKLTETIGSTCLLKSIIEAEKRPSTPVSKPEKKEEVFLPPAPRREDQGIFDYAANMRPYYTRSSPVPHAEVLPSPHQVPHDTRSLLPPASLVRPLSPDVTISFPPVFPVLPGKPRSRCTSPTPAQNVSSQSEPKVETTPTKAPPALTRSPPKESKENYNELENIPAITVAPEHVYELPKYHETPGLMAQAMTTAPITPFNPVPFPEPIEIPSMKPLPPETKPVLIRPESPMLNALTVAPDRSYSPLPSVTKPLDTLTKLADINKPVNILLGEKEEKPKKEPPCYSMLSALTIASDRPYSPLPAPPPPAPTPVVHVITDAPFETYVPKIPGSQQADSKSQAKGSDKIHKSGDEIGGDITHSHQFPLTSSGLHIPATIPHYQEHIDECDIHTKLRNSPLLIKTAAQESVSIQSKIMNILSQQETSSVKTTAISAEPLKSSALDFLKQKDDTAKIIPTLGYKPNSLLDSTKSITQTTQKEGTQIVHEEISATISEKTSSSITKSSYEQVESSTQLTQEKVCQQVCQSQCPPSQCLKTKQTIQESVQKSEPKPIFEPKVKFERQNTFEPKSDVITPKYNGNTTSTAPTVSSELSRKLSSLIPSMPSDPNPSSLPSNTGSGAGGKGGSSGLTTAPRRGRGVLNPQNLAPGARVPLCGQCYQQIR
jgi:hypothetical protein